jgi:hypothetical protein
MNLIVLFEPVIKRKINEALGGDVFYELGQPAVSFKLERQEHNLNGRTVCIFGIGYEAKYIAGEITLGEHHDQIEWVDIPTFKPEDYFTGGWLTGVNEYLSKVRT